MTRNARLFNSLTQCMRYRAECGKQSDKRGFDKKKDQAFAAITPRNISPKKLKRWARLCGVEKKTD